MTKEELTLELASAIVSYKKSNVLAAVEKARPVMQPTEIIEAMAKGMTEVGVRFERGRLFLPHVIAAAEAMTSAVKILEKDMPVENSGKKLPGIVMATIEGDVHDIGKSIVSTLLQCAGYEVFDLGRDVPIRKIIDTAKQNHAKMVGLSALMTTTMQGQKDCIELLKEEGLRDAIKVMVGGAPATQAWADKIGADGYGENAGDAVRKAGALLVGA